MKLKLLSVLSTLGFVLSFSSAARAEAISEINVNSLLNAGVYAQTNDDDNTPACSVSLSGGDVWIVINGDNYTIHMGAKGPELIPGGPHEQ